MSDMFNTLVVISETMNGNNNNKKNILLQDKTF